MDVSCLKSFYRLQIPPRRVLRRYRLLLLTFSCVFFLAWITLSIAPERVIRRMRWRRLPSIFNISTANASFPYPYVKFSPPDIANIASSITFFLHDSQHSRYDAERLESLENHTVVPLLRFLRKHPNVSFLDFGSFVGLYTLHVANLGRRVVAVDANHQSLQRLAASVSTNGFQDRVTLVHNALDSSYGTRYLRLMKLNVGSSRIVSEARDTVPVEAIKADDLLTVINFKRAVLKVDIEGFEHKMLEGAHSLFSTLDIVMVLMKWYQTREESERQLIHHFLESRAFQAYPSIDSSTKLNSRNDTTWPIDVVWKPTL